jgi:L-ascorbate metabolism protein UlaG (beta-lactamase superfamily)
MTSLGVRVRYRNIDGSLPPGPGDVFKWAVIDRVKGARVPNRKPFDVPRIANDGAALRANDSEATVTWVGHATWLVQLAGVNMLLDPIWASSIGGVIPRLSAPGLAMDHLPRVDAVLVTHNHRDHMDAPTLRKLAMCGRAVVPMHLGVEMRRLGFGNVIELDWWQHTRVGAATITFVPSQHWSRRGLADTNDTLWGGFVMEGGGKRVYHSGDTAYFSGFLDIARRCGSPDVALLPIGAYEPEWFMRKQHMNPEDALRAGLNMDAKQILAMHWGTYQLTDEWPGEPPLRFVDLAARDSRVQERSRVVPIGSTVRLDM